MYRPNVEPELLGNPGIGPALLPQCHQQIPPRPAARVERSVRVTGPHRTLKFCGDLHHPNTSALTARPTRMPQRNERTKATGPDQPICRPIGLSTSAVIMATTAATASR